MGTVELLIWLDSTELTIDSDSVHYHDLLISSQLLERHMKSCSGIVGSIWQHISISFATPTSILIILRPGAA